METPSRASWPNRVTVFIEGHQRVLACLVSIAILLALHLAYRLTDLPYDSAEYWALSQPQVLANHPTSRGYFFPTLLMPLRYLFDHAPNPALVFRLGLSVAYGLALALAVPAFFTELFGGTVSFVRRLVPVVLLAVIFPGVLLYPLSDFPALLLAMSGLYLASRALKAHGTNRGFAMLAAAGVLMGAAYNTRTIYLFALLGLVVFVVLGSRAAASKASRLAAILALLAGALAVALPQWVVNKRTHGISSLAVKAMANKHSLFASQLVWGMAIQRYETTVAPGAPAPTVFYLDPAGEKLAREAMQLGDPYSVTAYLRFVAQKPLDFLALYTRHAINGLDVRDGIVYTRRPSSRRNSIAVVNFAVLALACWVAWSLRSRFRRPEQAGSWPAPAMWPLSLAILVLPAVAILPGAIETRFFLPLHVLAYGLIAFRFDRAGLASSIRSHGLRMALATAAFAALFFTVSTSTMTRLQYSWPSVYTEGPYAN